MAEADVNRSIFVDLSQINGPVRRNLEIARKYIDTVIAAVNATIALLIPSTAYTAYTPVVKFGATVHTPGAVDGRWRAIGNKTIVGHTHVKLGATITAGALSIEMPTLPKLPGAGIVQVYMQVVGHATFIDISAGAFSTATVTADSTGTLQTGFRDQTVTWSNIIPATMAVGDEIHIMWSYEAA